MIRIRIKLSILLLAGLLPLCVAMPYAGVRLPTNLAAPRPEMQIPAKTEESLRKELLRLRDALNHRDLERIRDLIHPSRLYVELEERQGAYLSTNQTLAVIESFFRTRTVLSASFDYIDSDDKNATASGALSVRKDGRTLNYRIDFGFVRTDKQRWYLSRIHIQ